jgi:hypothetical protein
MAESTAIQTRFRDVISTTGCVGVSKLSPKGIATITLIPYCTADGSEPIPFTISCSDLSGAISVDSQPTIEDIPSQCIGVKETLMTDYTVKITLNLRLNKWLENARLLSSTYGISAGEQTVDGVAYDVRGISVSSLNKPPNLFYVELQPAEATGAAYRKVYTCCQLQQAVQGSTSFGKTEERTLTIELNAIVPPEQFRNPGNPLSSFIEYTYLPQAA